MIGGRAEPPHADGRASPSRAGTLTRMATTAPAQPAGRTRRLVAPVAAAVGVAAAWAAVAWLRPDDAGPVPCPWRLLTGLDCPFCGSSRAAASLAHGDLLGALDHNALFVVALLPVALLGWLAWTRAAWRERPAPQVPTRAIVVGLVVTLVWWALRLVVPWLGSAAS